MNRCKDCGFHDQMEGNRHGLGWCVSKKLTDDPYVHKDWNDVLRYSYFESGSFITGPDFGCVHWKPKDAQ